MSKKYTSKDLRDEFSVSIQFWNDIEHGSSGMSLTTNTDSPLDVTSMRVHGANMAKNDVQFDGKDHDALQAFCSAYLESSGYYVR